MKITTKENRLKINAKPMFSFNSVNSAKPDTTVDPTTTTATTSVSTYTVSTKTCIF